MKFAGLLIGLSICAGVAALDIEGAYQRTIAGNLNMAIRNTERLFADKTVVFNKELALDLNGDMQELAGLEVYPNLSFTVAVKNLGQEGKVTIKIDERQITQNCPANAYTRFRFPAVIFFDPATPPVKIKILASADQPVRLGAVSVYRDFVDSFDMDSGFPVKNVFFADFGGAKKFHDNFTPGSHRVDQTWNTPKIGEHDGVVVAQITENYQPVMATDKSNPKGVEFPIVAKNGAYCVYFTYSNPTLTEYPEQQGHINDYTGEKNQWNQGCFGLKVTELDTNADGRWIGRLGINWQHANTLIQTYGTGEIAYVAILPQNRLTVPAGAKMLQFQYIAADRQPTAFSAKVPEGAIAAGLVNIGPGATQLIWQTADGWAGGAVIRNSYYKNYLQIVGDTLTIQ